MVHLVGFKISFVKIIDPKFSIMIVLILIGANFPRRIWLYITWDHYHFSNLTCVYTVKLLSRSRSTSWSWQYNQSSRSRTVAISRHFIETSIATWRSPCLLFVLTCAIPSSCPGWGYFNPLNLHATKVI